MANGDNTALILIIAAAIGVAVYMYVNKKQDNDMHRMLQLQQMRRMQQLQQQQSQHHQPRSTDHVVIVQSHDPQHHAHENFAYSDIKNSYLTGGHSDLQLATDAESQNIGGILTNTKDAKGQVINVGMNLMNEFALQARDNRVVESYVMDEHQYGAGTPNYRKLAGWY